MAEFRRWVQHVTLRSLWQNKLRTILTILGVTLGVGILLAINLANDMALSNFKDSIDRVSGKSNLTIRPTQQDVLDEALLNRLKWIWLLKGQQASRFIPGIEQTALWAGQETSNTNPAGKEVIQMLGLDILSTFKDSGSGMTLIAQTASPLDILKPNHAYIGESLAKAHQLKPGDTFPLFLNDRTTRFTVAGILSESGLGHAYGGSLAVLDLSTAQSAFSMPGVLTKIDLIVPDELITPVQNKLKSQIPSGISVQRPTQRSAQVEKMIRSYQYNLTTLSFISLLVGVFLIYNTMSITIIRRRPEIGTLRAIGFSKGHIFSLFLIEALIIGLIGTTLGLGFGVFLSKFASKAVATTVANLYTGQVLDMFSVNPWLLAQAFCFGILMTVIGAMAPVLEATSVAPAEAARRASYESRIVQSAGTLSLIGLGFAVVACIAAVQPPVSGFVAALCAILAAALWMPSLLKRSLTALLPVLQKSFQTEGRLAGLILRGALGRTAVAVASLMIGIAMMVSLAVMISSFRQTVITWVQQTLKADLWIEPASKFGSKQTGRIDPQAVAIIRTLPGIAGVDAFYEFPIEYKGNPTRLGIGDFPVLAKHGNLLFLNNEAPGEVLKRVTSHPSVIVTEAFSTRNGVRQGDTLQLETPSGTRPFTVEAVYYDYSSDLGYIVMPRQWYRQFYRDERISNIAVYLKPGVSPVTITQNIRQALHGQTQLRIRSNQELREEVLRIFDKTFAITYALHVIAIAVALLAVMNSLFALVLEARREFGILKYLGTEDRQIAKIVLVKAGLLGLFGNISGLLVGLILSFLLIYVINKQSFGWTIRFELPLAFLIQSFLLVMATSIFSGLIPARLASQTPAPQVIKTE
jgi:putative ABC transport system permease protein